MDLKNRKVFREEFLKLPSKGVSGNGLGQWTNSATDLSNIASGYNEWFEASATTANALTVAFYGGLGGGIKLSTAQTAQGDDAVLRPITQATAQYFMGTKATNFNLNLGYSFWLTWAWSRQAPVGTTTNDIFQGCGWGSSSAAGASGVISAASTTNDTDQVLFVWQPALHPNLRLYTCSDGTGTYYDLGIVPTLNVPMTCSLKYLADSSAGGYFDVFVNGDYRLTTTTVNRKTDDTGDGVIPVPFAFIETRSSVVEGTSLAVHGVEYEIDYTT